ncbi:FAD-binding oxidoreductase [Actinomadura atramentaria]|uniref:FAD-binding oxidoreductase n=1 Tax=Actinomadura atramentaria TaxID=1990 RepID=UPI00036C946B|nr:BBE domain-containing protein [Actinomadura atramentaria]
MNASDPLNPAAAVVRPGDKRYPALSRGFNQRWIAEPEYVRLVRSPEEARAALGRAVREEPADPRRTRITVRSGGHCYEDFVCGDDVRVILDVSPMCAISYDAELAAHRVEAGATNWHVYSHLYPLYGVALPGGSCYSVGLGGHITGGGFGLLSRRDGLTVDYLYAVEVAVVREDGEAELVVATRDDDGDLGDLFWAHTGGGGGNFGVITRFWFRDLPEPPERVLLTGLAWEWDDFAREDFADLVTAFGEYFRDRQDPATAAGGLFAMLKLTHVSNGQIGLLAQVELDDDGAGEEAMAEFLAAVDGRIRPESGPMFAPMGEHAALAPAASAALPRVMPWLTATQALNASGENRCGKYKSAYLRRPFDRDQIDAMWAYLGNEEFTSYENKEALIQIDSYGSAINRPPFDTAVRQRDSIMKMQYQVYWTRHDPDEPAHIAWLRETYRATFAATGGVPVVGDRTDGCYVSYPDADLSDPEWNASAQSWATLYYKDAYERLRRVKRRWDPLNVFRHHQSVEP